MNVRALLRLWHESTPSSSNILCEKREVKVTRSCPILCDPVDYSSWNSPGQNTGVGCLSLLQGIFPTQGLNPGLLHGRQILDQLSYQGSPTLCTSSQSSEVPLPISMLIKRLYEHSFKERIIMTGREF